MIASCFALGRHDADAMEACSKDSVQRAADAWNAGVAATVS